MNRTNLRLAFSLSCTDLANLDLFSKTDPMVVVSIKNNQTEEWKEAGRTEIQKDVLDPQFATAIVVDFKFELPQVVRFLVFDVDNVESASPTTTLIGASEQILIGDMLRSKGRIWEGPVMREHKPQGKVRCVIDEMSRSKEVVKFHFRGIKLDSKDLFSASDPYLEIERQRGDASWVTVHKTEYFDNEPNPVWKEFSISVPELCATNTSPIRISCYDYDFATSSDLIGRCTTTFEEIIQQQHHGQPITLSLIDLDKNKNNGVSGTLSLNTEITTSYSFLDYLAGGCELSLVTVIDYTISNGDVQEDPKSLHRISSGASNPYEFAIQAVGNILAAYDSDGRFQVLGFGAKIHGTPNPCFGLTDDAGVKGIGGVLETYRNFTATVVLWGPTTFAPCIQQAIKIASQFQTQQNQKYFVLLIITDGSIADLDETKSAIIDASMLPLSIVIIGVGNENFSEMQILDSDKSLLSHNGRNAVRDIVQFVPLREYSNTPDKLAEVTLAEIPEQVVSFFRLKGFVPNTPP